MTITLGKVLFVARNIMALRTNDIILTSFPRAGSTWVRFILCNYLSLQEMAGRAIDLQVLDDIMPTLSKSNLVAPWPYSVLPRFIKTHQPYRPIVFAMPRNVVYVLRDPRDVMVSYYHFLQNHTSRQAPKDFAVFIRHEQYGLGACLQHYVSWRPHISFTLSYEALKHDAESAMLSCFDTLRIPADSEVLRESTERSRFKEMRSTLEKRGLSHAERFDPAFRVVRKGSTQEWVNYFTQEDMSYYMRLREQMAFDLYP